LGIARAIAEARALSDRLAGAPFLSSTGAPPALIFRVGDGARTV